MKDHTKGKITIIGPAYPYRGGQSLVEAHLFETLNRLGYDCNTISFTLLYPKIFFPGTTQFDESGTTFFKHESKITRLINSINPVSWFRTIIHLRKMKPDVIIFVWWMPFFGPAYWTIGTFIKRLIKTRTVFLIENYISHENMWFDKLASKITLNMADYYICQSKYTARQIEANHPNKRIFQTTLSVFDCYNLNKFTRVSAREHLGIKTNNVILFFGLIRAYKGLDKLIKAFKLLREEMPDTTLLIVGECYDDEHIYRKLIADEKLEEHTIMINRFIPNEEVEVFFKAADMTCLPYNSATQSGILMMAYGFRIPSVVTDVGGLAELIKEGETGLVVKNNDPDVLKTGIKKILLNEEDVDFKKNIGELSNKLGYIDLSSIFNQIIKN